MIANQQSLHNLTYLWKLVKLNNKLIYEAQKPMQIYECNNNTKLIIIIWEVNILERNKVFVSTKFIVSLLFYDMKGEYLNALYKSSSKYIVVNEKVWRSHFTTRIRPTTVWGVSHTIKGVSGVVRKEELFGRLRISWEW